MAGRLGAWTVEGMNITLLIAAAVAVLLVLSGIRIYNKLIRLKNSVIEGMAQIDVQLQRRSDLIPNLVKTVKGYAAHEKEALESVIAARGAALGAHSLQEKVAADNALTGALRGIFALAESYPDLKASANFIALQEELTATENKIAFARQRYNALVLSLNTAVESIPTKFFVGVARVTAAEFYEVDDPADRDVPEVSF